jgi:hypothetical protein
MLLSTKFYLSYSSSRPKIINKKQCDNVYTFHKSKQITKLTLFLLLKFSTTFFKRIRKNKYILSDLREKTRFSFRIGKKL